MYLIRDNSGADIVIKHIKLMGRGTIFDVDDFKGLGVTYTYLRTIFIDLLSRKFIVRISRGLYYYPNIKKGKDSFPSLDKIIGYVSEKYNFEHIAADEYAEYVLGLRETCPQKIDCYINGKIRYMNLTDGHKIAFRPSKRAFCSSFSNYMLAVLYNYINLSEKHFLTKDNIKKHKKVNQRKCNYHN